MTGKTKARTKSQRRRKGKITLPGGEEASARPTGRDRRHTHQPQEDARLPMLTARARQQGLPATKETLTKMTAQYNGCEAGKAISAQPISDAAKADLFAAVQHVRKTWAAFDRAIGAPDRHAKVARILAPTAAMEATAASPAIDMRDDETKLRQAVAARQAVEGWLCYADNAAAHAVKLHCLDEPDVPVRDVAGMIAGLLCICDGLAGRRVVYRRRK